MTSFHERCYLVDASGTHALTISAPSRGGLTLHDSRDREIIPSLLCINGMNTTLADALADAADLQRLCGVPVVAIYNGTNRVPHAVLAKLAIADDLTRFIAALITSAIEARRPLIISAQSLGTIKIQNAARITARARAALYARSMALPEARAAAMRDMRLITCIFTGNALWRIAPFLHGHTIYNHGDPVTLLLGSRQGGPCMPPLTLRVNPRHSLIGPHHYVNQVAAVAALVRLLREQ
jgi:hypothetical protein